MAVPLTGVSCDLVFFLFFLYCAHLVQSDRLGGWFLVHAIWVSPSRDVELPNVQGIYPLTQILYVLIPFFLKGKWYSYPLWKITTEGMKRREKKIEKQMHRTTHAFTYLLKLFAFDQNNFSFSVWFKIFFINAFCFHLYRVVQMFSLIFIFVGRYC